MTKISIKKINNFNFEKEDIMVNPSITWHDYINKNKNFKILKTNILF